MKEKIIIQEWWFWVILGFVVLIICSFLLSLDLSDSNDCLKQEKTIENLEKGLLNSCELINIDIRVENAMIDLIRIYKSEYGYTLEKREGLDCYIFVNYWKNK